MILAFTRQILCEWNFPGGVAQIYEQNFWNVKIYRKLKLPLETPSLLALDERLDDLANFYVNYLPRLFKVVTVSTTDETRVPHVPFSRPL